MFNSSYYRWKLLLTAFILVQSLVFGATGPEFCGDEGTNYLPGDITGPNGVPDCIVDLRDLAHLASEWLVCFDPENNNCDYLNLVARRDIDAIQTEYINGVPHTNPHGVPRIVYDPSESFFPIMIWGAVPSTAGDYDWDNLAAAGFNTVVPWILGYPQTFLQQGADAGLQVVLMGAWGDTYLNMISGHPNLLGLVWADEPIASLEQGNIEQLYAEFIAYKTNANQLAPNMRVLVSDAPWITEPAKSWWITWNTAGDVTCHKNYVSRQLTDSIALDPDGIPQSAKLAVESNSEAKPFWFIVGTHESIDTAGGEEESFCFPSQYQLRAMVYSAIIHGATGIAYYTWDCSKSRVYDAIGISENPLQKYVSGQPSASPSQIMQSKSLWATVKQINGELITLTEAILSPTVDPAVLNYSLQIEGEGITHAPIRTLLKRKSNGDYILMTVNLDNTVFKVNYYWPSQIASVQPLFENRPVLTLEAGNLSFSDYYECFDVHVYQIDVVP